MLDKVDASSPVLRASSDAQPQVFQQTQAGARGEPGRGVRGGVGTNLAEQVAFGQGLSTFECV